MSGASIFVMTVLSLFVLGAALAIRTARFVRRARHVRAKVVVLSDASVDSHDTATSSAGVDRFTVELRLDGGGLRKVQLADAFGGSLAASLVGSDGTLPVVYDPGNPAVVRIDTIWALYFIPAFVCAPAVLLLVLAAFVWLAR
ncbi:MAG: DUF3592 domain-containing protein [Rhodothermales bacterium]